MIVVLYSKKREERGKKVTQVTPHLGANIGGTKCRYLWQEDTHTHVYVCVLRWILTCRQSIQCVWYGTQCDRCDGRTCAGTLTHLFIHLYIWLCFRDMCVPWFLQNASWCIYISASLAQPWCSSYIPATWVGHGGNCTTSGRETRAWLYILRACTISHVYMMW